MRCGWIALAAFSGLLACRETPPQKRTLKVAAAADLSLAFAAVGAEFEAESGVHPVFTFGSTGLLAQQIGQGAPFDVFAAANRTFAEELVASGACRDGTQSLYARGRIVVWSRKDAGLHPESLASLRDARYAHISIANPEHAPYGRAAVEALKRAGVYDDVKARLVFGENVQQAMQFAESGNADAAIVALSLASTGVGEYRVIEETLHDPIDQAMVICSAHPDAAAFTQFVGSTKGRATMRRFGFLLPGEKYATAP